MSNAPRASADLGDGTQMAVWQSRRE